MAVREGFESLHRQRNTIKISELRKNKNTKSVQLGY